MTVDSQSPPTAAEIAAQIAAVRGQYLADVAGGLDRFFEPHRTDCPWCGSDRLGHLLYSPDLVQHKPGRFRLMTCRTCDHVFQNPRLSPAGLEFYYRDFYDGAGGAGVEGVFELGRDGNLARARHFRELYPPSSPGPARWIDVGTGYGHFCRDAREVWPATRFEGLDMGVSVQVGKDRGWLDEAHRGLLPDLAPALAGQYDVVSMHHYLEHTREPRAELDAAVSLLAEGGYLMIEVPNPDSRFGRLVKHWWFPWLQPQHLNFVTRANLMQALVHRGLRPVAEIRGESHIPVDLTFLALLPLLRWGPYPDMPWFADANTPARKRRFAAVVKLGKPVHRIAKPLDAARHKLALITDRGNTFRVIARKVPTT